MKVLVTGAGGMLGAAFVRALKGDDVAMASRDELDISDPGRVRALVTERRPEVVINCAAHTDVDSAERDPDPAFAANAVLPGLLAEACAEADAMLVHISSTGCYGTAKTEPYTEADPLEPTTVHHRSKAAGEDAVRAAGPEHLILRTGWLFGGEPGAPKNFVWKRLLEARGAERMTSDASQRGNPTLVDDLTRQTLELLAAGQKGTFNVVGAPGSSRADYVAAIVAASGLPCRVEPSTTPFQRAARVSPNETALNARLAEIGLDHMPDWRTSLSDYVRRLMASPAWRALEPAS